MFTYLMSIGATPPEDACFYAGNPEVLGAMISAGIRPDYTNENGDTAVMATATSRLHDTLKKLLAMNVVDIDARNSRGETALWQSTNYGRLENAQILLEAGANPNVKNAEHESVLILCMKYRRNFTESNLPYFRLIVERTTDEDVKEEARKGCREILERWKNQKASPWFSPDPSSVAGEILKFLGTPDDTRVSANSGDSKQYRVNTGIVK